MRGLVVAAFLLILPAPAFAEAVGPPRKELSVHTQLTVYTMLGGKTQAFAGPKLAIDYGTTRGEHLWLNLGLGLASGVCMRRGDEGDCVLSPGLAIEPTAGIKVKTSGVRTIAYLKLVAGALVIAADRGGGGTALLMRAGGGVKWFASDRAAFGFELTGAAGAGSFQLGYAGNQSAVVKSTVVNVDAGVGLELRF